MPALLCDVDGTLVDTTYLHTVSWWQALVEAGRTVPMVDIRAAIGMGADQLLPHLLGHNVDADLRRSCSERHDALLQPLRHLYQPTRGAAELLRAVAARDVTVVLASSAGADELTALRAAIGADDAIAAATTADDVTTTKPAPDIVHRALSLAGVEAGDAVFLGDAVWDVVAAQKADIPCVAVTCGGTSATKLSAAGAIAVYPDPGALLADLDKYWDASS